MNERLPDRRRLAEIARRFPSLRLAVIGDLIADVFLYGEIARISREAPVMILREERTITVPGGAGNAAANAAALGAQVDLVGVVGMDSTGSELLGQLQARAIHCSGVRALEDYRTPTKTRILAGLPGSARQQVIRVDHEPRGILTDEMRKSVRSGIEVVEGSSAVILSDYQYGVLEGELLEELLRRGRPSRIPWVADSRHRLDRFRELTAATPNKSEAEELLGRPLESVAEVRRSGSQLRETLGADALLVTLGREGMMLFAGHTSPVPLGVVGSREPVDVTGAGDTVIAAFTLALGAGATFLEAASLANHAAGVAVMKRGTASVSTEELEDSISRYAP